MDKVPCPSAQLLKQIDSHLAPLARASMIDILYAMSSFLYFFTFTIYLPSLKNKKITIYCISHYFRVQLFSRFWTFAVIREWLISRFF